MKNPGFVDVRGQRLRVAVRPGDPRRTPLLLCTGIGVGFEAFDAFVDALDPGIPVIRFDPPGAGGSPLPSVPYRLPGLAWAVLEMVDLLGYPQVDVLGVSWGGALAQQIAHTGRDRCRRLVLVRLATPRRYRDPHYVRRVAPGLYGGSARTDPHLAARILHDRNRTGPAIGYLYQLLATAGWTSIPFLPFLRQPTLVLSGDDDPIIPLVNGHLLSTLIPHARLHVYRGGHIELAVAPARLVPVIEEFLHGDSPAPLRHESRKDEHDG
jgi:poly(3-hydroxyalkanoate) depolymerase